MNINITGKNIAVTDGLRDAVNEKLGKLERYFTPTTTIQVTMSVEKERQKIEVTIPMKGTIIRSEQTSSDMYVSIGLVVEILERQIKRYKAKLITRSQSGEGLSGAEFSPAFLEEEFEENDAPKIVRTKKFGVKPMDPEEACIQMELLEHNFYVFRNSATDEVNVVYKRKNGTYGLIEPEE